MLKKIVDYKQEEDILLNKPTAASKREGGVRERWNFYCLNQPFTPSLVPVLMCQFYNLVIENSWIFEVFPPPYRQSSDRYFYSFQAM